MVERAAVSTKVVELCAKGDDFLQERLKNTFNKPNKKGEKIEKGIAFPTCMSINNTVCHFTPVTGDETTI